MPSLPITRITVNTAAGSDPDAIDDAELAVGSDLDWDEFGELFEPCPNNPRSGQCEYTAADGFARCKHCGMRSEI